MDSLQVYEIKVQGQLGSEWSTWFGGMCVLGKGEDYTVLTGPVIDQSALHGLLVKIRDLNLTLVEVRQLPVQTGKSNGGNGSKVGGTTPIKHPEEVLHAPGIHRKTKPGSNGNLIEMCNLEKIYRTPAGSFPALRRINLKVGSGEFVAVVGKSGSGKTTMINMLTGIDRPSSGKVFVDGVDIHAVNESSMSRWRGHNLGVVFQFFQLLPTLTLVENVTLPMDLCGKYLQKERRERALHLLDLVDIAENADKLPSQISGGQQQRAAIARALANDPPIIAADEPTGNLDSKSAETIITLFQNLVDRGKTILMVTHDPDLANRASRIVELADGSIIRS